MNYRIEKKEAFMTAGYTQEMIKIENGENFYEISRFWSHLTEVKINQLMAVSNGAIQGLLGVSDSNKSQQESFKYMIGISTNDTKNAASDLDNRSIPESDWAVFECIGAISAGVKAIDEDQPFELNGLMQLKNQTSSPWIEGSIVENTEIPRVEFYPLGDMEAEDYQCELWIPIKSVKK